MIAVLVTGADAADRAHVAALLADARMTVVGQADPDGLLAAVAERRPDVVVAVAGAGATRAVRALMTTAARPVLALQRDPEAGDAAHRAGAVDVLPLDAAPATIRHRVRILSGVAVVTRRAPAPPPATAEGGPRVIGVVASTGGPPAVARLLGALRGTTAPILLVQHLDPGFVPGLAAWLEGVTGLRCRIPADGDLAAPGTVSVAPAGQHLRLGRGGRCALDPDPPALHRPSGDLLLRSLAEHAGAGAVGVVLTGMGADGADGLRAIEAAGGRTYVQDQASCAVYGMPRAAAALVPAARAAEPAAIGRAVLAGAAQPAGGVPA